jgi:predicted ATPase
MLRIAWNVYRGWATRASDLENEANLWEGVADVCVLLAAVSGAASIAPLVSQYSYELTWLASLATVGFVGALYLAHDRRDFKASGARAAAELIKSECYCFAATAGPYAISDADADKADVARAFQRRVAWIERPATYKGLVRGDDPVPSSRDESEPIPGMTKDWYKTNRIERQLEYYRAARVRGENYAPERWFFTCVCALAAAGLGYLGARSLNWEPLDFAPWLGVVATIGASVAKWLQIHRNRKLISRRAKLRSRLEQILGLDEVNPMAFTDLVTETENLLRGEYKAWQPQSSEPQPEPEASDPQPQAPATQPELKAVDALEQGQTPIAPPILSIALSFASEDSEIADALKGAIQKLNHPSIRILTGPEPASSTWRGQITDMLDETDILIPITAATTKSLSLTGFEIGAFSYSLRRASKMKGFPFEDRLIISFSVVVSTSEMGNAQALSDSLDGAPEIRIDIDAAVSPGSPDFEENKKRNVEVILALLNRLIRIVDQAQTTPKDIESKLPRIAFDLYGRLFEVTQNKQTESHRDIERVKEDRAITEERYLERNLKDTFVVQSFSWNRLSVLEDGQYRLSPRINVLLGKNGYGKTVLLRTLAALLQRDAEHSGVTLKGTTSDNSVRLAVDVTRNGRTETISRDNTYFLDRVGRIPVLAIPDSRFINRTQVTVAGTALSGEPLERSGARNFLNQEPYENVIQDLLTRLGLEYMKVSDADESRRFDRPIFRLVERVVAELTEDRDFRFADIRQVETRFQILVYTAGATQVPIPIQSASQGTLSVVAMFGLIYSFLRSLHTNIDEEDILNADGIVLIDEIDAHLHPSWQQKLLMMLTRVFPNVQFIVSAHSPFIVAGCDQDEVSVLRRRETGAFYLETLSRDFLGVASGELYREVFEIDDIDRLYLEFLTKAGTSTDDSGREIEALEHKPKLSEEEERRLVILYRETRLIARGERASEERLKTERKDAVIARLEAEVEQLKYTLREREDIAPSKQVANQTGSA